MILLRSRKVQKKKKKMDEKDWTYTSQGKYRDDFVDFSFPSFRMKMRNDRSRFDPILVETPYVSSY